MQRIPINTYDSPTVILELIYRLKVKHVMCQNVISAGPERSLRQLQQSMKRGGITGIPIVEEKKLLGIVSMDDIIHALEGGYIDEPAREHMSRKLIVLEEDMPVSFAITYFDKYPYHRFPVLNKEHQLSGIVTSRDITTRLLLEINKEIEKIERVEVSRESPKQERQEMEFRVIRYDFENAGHASTELKKCLKKRGSDPKLVRRVAIAAYELEMNLVVHSDGGSISFEIEPDLVRITSRDTGPGIPDVKSALEEGWSTADEWIRSLGFGAGMGLPNTRRVSDHFEITSQTEGSDRGTWVKVEIHTKKKEEEEK
jgi:CBS domain-containing protein/anti-sigma regulatory factor (Ser/Thr protein kinase)